MPRPSAYCLHCRNNPRAKKPYDKMKTIPLDELPETEAHLKQEAHRTGEKPDCVLCKDVKDMLDALKA